MEQLINVTLVLAAVLVSVKLLTWGLKALWELTKVAALCGLGLAAAQLTVTTVDFDQIREMQTSEALRFVKERVEAGTLGSPRFGDA